MYMDHRKTTLIKIHLQNGWQLLQLPALMCQRTYNHKTIFCALNEQSRNAVYTYMYTNTRMNLNTIASCLLCCAFFMFTTMVGFTDISNTMQSNARFLCHNYTLCFTLAIKSNIIHFLCMHGGQQVVQGSCVGQQRQQLLQVQCTRQLCTGWAKKNRTVFDCE